MLLFILMTGSREWAQQTKTAAAASQLDITNLNVVSNAVWLFSLSPSCRQFCWTAKDGRFMKAQTLPILRSHKTLTYLLCRLTGRQAVSKYTVPETSSYYFWNTQPSLLYIKCTNDFYRYWIYWYEAGLHQQRGKKDCKTDFHRFTFNWVKMQKRRTAAVTMIHDVLIWQKLHPQRHPFWLALEKCDILTAIYKCASLLKRNKIKH